MLVMRLEDRRVSHHLSSVERLLRSRKMGHLSMAQARRRSELLDQLAAYRRRGVFPRNKTRALLTPVFVDGDGRECAVAHLIGSSTDLVRQVVASQNLDRIEDISSREFDSWQRASGLETRELALIQPGYPEFAGSVARDALPLLLSSLIGLTAGWLLHGLRRLRYRVGEPAALVLSLFLSYVAVLSGWDLIGLGTGAMSLPNLAETSGLGLYVYKVPDLTWGLVIGVVFELGACAILGGIAVAARSLGAPVRSMFGANVSDLPFWSRLASTAVVKKFVGRHRRVGVGFGRGGGHPSVCL